MAAKDPWREWLDGGGREAPFAEQWARFQKVFRVENIPELVQPGDGLRETGGALE